MTARITAAEYQAQSAPSAQSKYRAKPTTVDGRRFDSKKEATRYLDLRNLQRAGLITRLQTQVAFELIGQNGPLLTDKGRPIRYMADFVYLNCSTGERVIEDTKGVRTKEYLLKKACMRAMGYTILET